MQRGLLIALEGADNAGKSYTAEKIRMWFNSEGYKSQILPFPNRNSKIGSILDSYLKNRLELNGRVAHLLFSANRWEKMNDIKTLLSSGVTIILDRYIYSGIIYSTAAVRFLCQS